MCQKDFQVCYKSIKFIKIKKTFLAKQGCLRKEETRQFTKAFFWSKAEVLSILQKLNLLELYTTTAC